MQVRQRVTHKRTFYYLEQLLLKHNAHSDCLNIVTFKDGMDFYFTEKQKAVRFIDFLESHVPTKVRNTHTSDITAVIVRSLSHWNTHASVIIRSLSHWTLTMIRM